MTLKGKEACQDDIFIASFPSRYSRCPSRHIVPLGNNSMLDRIPHAEDTSFPLGLVSNVAVLQIQLWRRTLFTRSPHDGGEDCFRGVIAGKASLARSGAVVNDYGIASCWFRHLAARAAH